MSHESFTRIGPYYDALMRGVPYTMWVSYFELLCSHLAHKPRNVLDVCCGTGTMCELLTEKELDLIGVDRSPTMIEAARKKADESGLPIRYYEQDIAEYGNRIISFRDGKIQSDGPVLRRRVAAEEAASLPPAN